MADFHTAYIETMKREGRYSNDTSDSGGETYKGISRNNYPDWEGWAIIDSKKSELAFPANLPLIDVLEEYVYSFYKKNYWDKAYLSEISIQDIATELFDTAINQGLNTTIEYFQQSLNLLNCNEKDYKDVKVDGVMGKKTLTAYDLFIKTITVYKDRTVEKNTQVLLKAINGMQFMRYFKLTDKNPVMEKFFYGWVLNRINFES